MPDPIKKAQIQPDPDQQYAELTITVAVISIVGVFCGLQFYFIFIDTINAFDRYY
jgi:hypothetical protein